jgi:hypothetical protein
MQDSIVFVPVLFFVAYLVKHYWPQLPHRPLAVLAIAVISVHQVVLTGDAKWWGGYTYGPRLSTDLVPWFVLLAIVGLKSLLDEKAASDATSASLRNRHRAALGIGALLLALSIAINGRGACSATTTDWNFQVEVDQHPESVWNWRIPQFLAGLHSWL